MLDKRSVELETSPRYQRGALAFLIVGFCPCAPKARITGQVEMIGGTLGLHFFGLTDLEYPASPSEPQFIIQYAY